jgi:hypothetical protein
MEGVQDLVAISSDPATINRRGHGWPDHPPAKERHVYTMKKSSAQKVESPSQLIDARIKELGDWRGKTLSRLRALIKHSPMIPMVAISLGTCGARLAAA